MALVAWHWLPLADWSLRVRTVLAGSALASIKFDSDAGRPQGAFYDLRHLLG